MLVRQFSDIHLEFADFNIPSLSTDAETVLLLNGDIGVVGGDFSVNTGKRLHEFLTRCSKQFKSVLYIFGNHEYYHGDLYSARNDLNDFLINNNLNNIHILENDYIEIDGITFIGATLWTDFNKHDPLAMYDAERVISDYRVIKYRTNRITSILIYDLNLKSKTFIENTVKDAKSKGNKVVVLTHHGISYQSVHPQYVGDSLNCLWVQDMDQLILDLDYDYHFHGHVHTSFDYMIGNTRVRCNPRGYYPRELNPMFIDNEVIVL